MISSIGKKTMIDILVRIKTITETIGMTTAIQMIIDVILDVIATLIMIAKIMVEEVKTNHILIETFLRNWMG